MRRPTPDPDPCQVVVTVLGWRSSRYLLACVAPVPCARRRCALVYIRPRPPDGPDEQARAPLARLSRRAAASASNLFGANEKFDLMVCLTVWPALPVLFH